jgi:signal transduction histidine kinase/AmiR/NasT family two-component response regulator
MRAGTEQEQRDFLLKTDALHDAILNSPNFSSIATDEDGIIQLFNVGAERMLGYSADDVVNKLSPAAISDAQELIERAAALSLELGVAIQPGFEALVFKAARGIEDIYDLTYLRKDGSHLPAIVSVTALRDADKAIIGYLLIVTDNTARKQIEVVRKQAEAKLQTAMEEAERANLAKSDFLSSMSHELRTPLSAILGFAQLLESGTPPPTDIQRRGIGQILKAGWYLLELINEVLDLALVESGRLSLSLEPISLADILQECQMLIESDAQKQGIQMDFPPSGRQYHVKADHTRIKQILINLLSNALKYNKPNGKVVVRYEVGAKGRIRIRVEDTGVGMTPLQLTQLFQPFNRLGRESSAVEGTGIGLVMTKRLTELMGGAMGVESQEGVGSTFWIELNLSAAPALADSSLHAVAERMPSLANSTQRTLLYVEDNPANLMLVEDLIARRPDMRLLSARDVPSGLKLAFAVMPDVILLDINLPGISGTRMMMELAAHPSTAHIPVVALSANAMPRDIEKGLEAGFFRYLTKPIKVPEFMETLDTAFALALTMRHRSTADQVATIRK